MTLRVAQIGCGYWGPNLLRNLLQMPDVDLVAVVEASEPRREFVASQFPGVKALSDHREAFDDPDIGAVVIATPAATHFDLALQALNAGQHALVEKPLAMSVAECDELEAAATRAGRTLMVGHTFLYNPAVTALKGLVMTGQLGEVHHLYTQRLNLGQVRSDVNAMWNLAPHDFSILLHLMNGELPATIAAHGVASVQQGIEDVVFITLDWRDKRVAHVHVSWLDPTKVRRVTVVGTKRMVVYDDLADAPLTLFDTGIDRVPRVGDRMDFDAPPHDLIYRQGEATFPNVAADEPLHAEIAHFLACVRSGDEPLTGATHARAVVRLLESAQTSLRLGGAPVDVS